MDRFLEKLEHDRRLARRFVMKTLLRLRLRKSETKEQEAESENISRRGVFFATDLLLEEGATLDLLLDMPEEISGVPMAQWLCMGHVVRVEQRESPKGWRGVGVEFDFYSVSRTERAQWSMSPGIGGPIYPYA